MRVLCLHGLGGTAATMQPLIAALQAAGHDAHAPTLPGHGTSAEDLLSIGWAEWLAAATSWPADVVAGQSMGGSLALALAADGACRAVVAINPALPDPDALEGLEWQLSRGIDWVDGLPLADGEEGYTRLPIRSLAEMVEGASRIDLAAVTVPILMVTGALDDTLDPFAIEVAVQSISGPVQRLELANSGHVATLGPDQRVLHDAIIEFAAALPN